MDEEKLDYILGGIAVIDKELKNMNTWLRKLYDIEMTVLAHSDAEIFNKVDTVHNNLGMYMDQDWEGQL